MGLVPLFKIQLLKTTLASSGVYYVMIDGKITYLNVIVGQEDLSGRTPISQTVVGGGLYLETYFTRYVEGVSYEWVGANNFTSNDLSTIVKGISKKSEGMYHLKLKINIIVSFRIQYL
jgi:hypothetical protein